MSELVGQVTWEAEEAPLWGPAGSLGLFMQSRATLLLFIVTHAHARVCVSLNSHPVAGKDSCLLCSPPPPYLIPSSLLSFSLHGKFP